jgi:hypothetical protein
MARPDHLQDTDRRQRAPDQRRAEAIDPVALPPEGRLRRGGLVAGGEGKARDQPQRAQADKGRQKMQRGKAGQPAARAVAGRHHGGQNHRKPGEGRQHRIGHPARQRPGQGAAIGGGHRRIAPIQHQKHAIGPENADEEGRSRRMKVEVRDRGRKAAPGMAGKPQAEPQKDRRQRRAQDGDADAQPVIAGRQFVRGRGLVRHGALPQRLRRSCTHQSPAATAASSWQ